MEKITWDEKKNDWLKANRLISFEEISAMIFNDDYLDIVENPGRGNQFYLVMMIQGYTWLVPFLIDRESIVLKTAFPGRKFHKRYGSGGGNEL
ncbi:MAG: BrnT family toxin [Candidatus Sabulitectum sp.]|nr:BrnT family toxin [Candidatus Sabulitectum sp.]